MVYKSPIRDHGETKRMNMRSYHAGPAMNRRPNLVITAAPRGMPRNAATLVATTEYEIGAMSFSSLMTLRKKIASGAKRTI